MKKPTKFIVTCHIDHTFNQTGLFLDLRGLDTAMPYFEGTLDNLAGCMALSRFWKYLADHKVPFYYTRGEEDGQTDARELAQNLDSKEYSVINIDVDEIDDPYTIARFDNVSGFSVKEMNDLKGKNGGVGYWFDNKYKFPCTYYRTVKHNEDFQDDSWIFAKYGYRVFTFTLPVQGKFHTEHALLRFDMFEKYCRALEALLKYFVDIKENA